ncbi:MAG: hypothetical protein QOK19_2170 [Solirubrobacteraceae bacterium]|jgi:hypothetical protein|nr:hypothetical protein [Solirubrobacterales bacterium]MEA2216609.1 hypothetical protein [Solirubrobacteraceae bacterium]
MPENPRPRDEHELIEEIRSIDVVAPPHLHERIEKMVGERDGGSARATGGGLGGLGGLRLRLGAAATALAAAAAAVALALSGSGSGALNLAQASAVTLRPATMGAPRESPSHRAQLTAAVEGISFPYWGERFGWRSAGARVDRVGGRTFKTVFYTDGKGRRVGYAIAAGTPAPSLAGAGRVEQLGGTPYRLGRAGGVEVVTWTRDGHLCVVSGRGVSGATLLALASWGEQPRAA